jgi:TRAP-type C4-dicarboxylate transport system permease small subunit
VNGASVKQGTRWEGRFAALVRASGVVGGLVIFLMTVMVTADVIMRNITGKPITGVFEVSQVSLLIATFLVLGYVQYYDKQLKADIFSSRAQGRKRAAVRLLDGVLSFCFFGVLLWTGSEEWVKAYQGNFLKRGLIDIPTVIPLGVLVFGTALTLMALVLCVARSFSSLRSGKPDAAPLEPGDVEAPLTDMTSHIGSEKT